MYKPKTDTNRRHFLRTSGVAASAAALAPGFTILAQEAKGANDRIGIGFIGTGGRAQAHLDIVNGLKQKGEAAAGRGLRRLPSSPRGRQQEDRRGEDVHGARGAAGRPQRRRRLHRHARPPARPADHRRDQGRQGRLLREAADALEPVRAGQEGRGRGQATRPARAGRHAAHGRRQLPRDHPADPRRHHRQADARHVQLLPPRRLGRADAHPRRQRQARPRPASGSASWAMRPRCRSRSRGSSSGGCTGTTRAVRPPTCSCTPSRRSSASSSSAIPSASSAAAGPSSTAARCPTSATSSPTIPAGRAS